MTTPRLALAGASGWMGRFIGPALLRDGVTVPEFFTALNRSGPNGDYDDFPGVHWEVLLAEMPVVPDVVILSVRPEDFRAGDFDCAQALVISVMAGVPITEITARTGARRVVRTVPNALVETGRSFTPWLASDAATAEDRALAQRILRSVGTEAEAPDEAALDVLTALAGAGTAYAALLASGLMQAARAAGLPEALAEAAVENLVCAAPEMLDGQIASAPELVQTYIEYQGVIAAGLGAAQAAGFEAALERSLAAAVARVQEMNAGA